MNTKRFNYKLSVFIVALVLSLLATACQSEVAEVPAPVENTTESVEEIPVAEPTAEMPAEEAPMPVHTNLALDPAGGADFQLVAENLYETLITVSDDQFFPWLAKSGTVANDGLDYIFELRPGVFFQDGTILDADAVIANFDRWFDEENTLRGDGDFSAWESAFGGFKGDADADGKPASAYDGIEKVNDLTVLVHLNQPIDDFFVKLSDPAFSMLSPTALAAGSYIGTGPYMIGEATDSSIDLVPYADYWGEVPAAELTITIE